MYAIAISRSAGQKSVTSRCPKWGLSVLTMALAIASLVAQLVLPCPIHSY